MLCIVRVSTYARRASAVLVFCLMVVWGCSVVFSAGQAPQALPGEIRLVLPPRIYATPGLECNIYFDNIVLALDIKDYAFDVTCSQGMQYQERWAYTPSEAEGGAYPITITVVDSSNTVVARGESAIHVVPDVISVGRGATLLIVGDSFAEYSVYPQHILDLSRRNGASGLRMIGSRGGGNMPPTTGLRHEGYSGWTAEAFTTSAGPLSRSGYHHRPGTGSPFVYTGGDDARYLDFGRYCDEFNEGLGPDLVTIQLGGNDVFSATDESIDAVVDNMLVHFDSLIDAMHKVRADTRIGVVIDTLPSTSQDGFRNYRGDRKQTRWRLRRNQHRMNERLIDHYRNRRGDHVYLIPNYLAMDCAESFPVWSPRRNARSEDKYTRVNNGTHPTAAGYQQMGDSIYAWLNGQLVGGH